VRKLERRRVVDVGGRLFLDGLESRPLSTSDNGEEFVVYLDGFRVETALE
jgi:hypothetical protein